MHSVFRLYAGIRLHYAQQCQLGSEIPVKSQPNVFSSRQAPVEKFSHEMRFR